MRKSEIRIVLAVLAAVMLLVGVLYGLQHSDLVQAERAILPSRPVAKSRESSSRAHLAAPSLALSKANVTATVSLHPPTDPLEVGQTFTVPVRISDLDTPLAAFQLDLSYDLAIIRFVGMEAGDGLRATGRSVVCPPHTQLAIGVRLACATTGDAPGVTAPGDLTVLTFVGLANGQTDLTLSAIKLPTDARPPVLVSDVTAQDATVIVGAACTSADLTVAFVTAEPAGSVDLTAQVNNTAGAQVPAGLPVAFYANGTHVGTAATTKALEAGASEVVTVTWTSDTPGDHIITIVANDDGTGTGPVPLCSAPIPVQQTVSILDVPLVESWNLMSAYVNPFTTDASVVQRPIAGQYVVIQGFDEEGAKSYYPDVPPAVNTLKDMDAEHGYWIKANAGISPTLRVVGEKFAEDRPIELNADWNLVSFLPRQPVSVTQALQSIDGQYTAVLGFEQGALSYYPHLDPSFNTLSTLKPLYGYWIRMAQPATLQYPTTGGGGLTTAEESAAVASIRQAERMAGVTPTHTWVNFYGRAYLEDGTPLPAGATVQALDADGVACGAAVVTEAGRYGLLACYGDDPTTPEDEGASPGDVLTFTINGQPATVSGEAVWTTHGDLQWVPLGSAPLWQVWLPVVWK